MLNLSEMDKELGIRPVTWYNSNDTLSMYTANIRRHDR